MYSGFISSWNNPAPGSMPGSLGYGSIHECLPVNGSYFSFTTSDIINPGLAAALAGLAPGWLEPNPICNPGQVSFWVTFQVVGGRAINVQ